MRRSVRVVGGWIALVTAIGQVLASVVGKVYLGSDARLVRRIERDVAVYDKLPAEAKDVMAQLLLYEIAQHKSRRMRVVARRVSPIAVFGIVFIAGVTAFIDWPLAYWAITYGWGWWIPFGVVTLFGLLLTIVGGVPQLFVYPDENKGWVSGEDLGLRSADDH